MIRTYKGITPTVPESAFVADSADVIGDVVLGELASVWFNAVVRGDVHYIRIGERTNVQDGAILHVTHDTHPLVIEKNVTVGHGAVLHGCHIKPGCLLGMRSVILDGAVVGENSIIAAGSVVTEGAEIPAGCVAMGSPAKAKRDVTDKDLKWLKESAENYIRYMQDYR